MSPINTAGYNNKGFVSKPSTATIKKEFKKRKEKEKKEKTPAPLNCRPFCDTRNSDLVNARKLWFGPFLPLLVLYKSYTMLHLIRIQFS